MSSSLVILILAVMAVLGAILLVGSFVGNRLRMPSGAPSRRENKYLDNLSTDLDEAGGQLSGLTPERFVIYQVIVGVVVTLGISAFGGFPVVAIAAGAWVGLYGMKSMIIGPRISKHRDATTRQVAECAREIAQQIRSKSAPERALANYANRARTGAVLAHITGEENIIARHLWQALYDKDRLGLTESDALRGASDKLGNFYFSSLIETYLQLVGRDNEQLAIAMISVAEEVEYIRRLTMERATAISQPLGSYKMVGAIALALGIFETFMLSGANKFLFSVPGQIFIVVCVGYWWLGSRLQHRSLNSHL